MLSGFFVVCSFLSSKLISLLPRRFQPKEQEVDSAVSYQIVLEKEPFHSSFKAWIRTVAFIVVAVFLPEQVSWAIEQDWRVLWPNSALASSVNAAGRLSGGFAPGYARNPININVPNTIKKLLQDINNKPITAIQLAPNVTVEMKAPLKMSGARIEQIYQWLLGKPCGTKALYDYLKMRGAPADESDIAVLALSVDILNDVIRPEGNPEVIKTSLLALSKASEFFNQKLIPVKLSTIDYRLSTNFTPFIAHFKNEHYVLVTQLSGEKAYFIDQHEEEFLPLEKFQEEFSGYALVEAANFQDGQMEIVPEEEAKSILGAGRSYSGRSVNISGLFKKPSTLENVIGIGSAIGGAFFMPANTNWWAPVAGAAIQVGGGIAFKDNMWGRIGTSVAAGFVTSGFSPYGVKDSAGKVVMNNVGKFGWAWKEAGIGAAKGLVIGGTVEGINRYVKINGLSSSAMSSIASLAAIPLSIGIEKAWPMPLRYP